ncbi:hypothetical protein CJF30_00010237 [Rutstroemia sp. NJR-2017a BBW]|nr:hypothetical protein CJF30_00010237 [Rutstroemia sp. NJR-2017a BBW]
MLKMCEGLAWKEERSGNKQQRLSHMKMPAFWKMEGL